jgi:uncharacterized Zn-binding protein involved in type VI secretion
MSGKPAARIGDLIACNIPQSTPAALPHAPPPGLPIIPPGAPTVFIGGQPAARIGDKSMCVAPAPTPNPIVKGAFPVRVGGSPAARASDLAAHPGSKISDPCCTTVEIGLAGTSGNRWAGEKACVDLAQGRNPPPGAKDPHGNQLRPHTQGQSYANCGIESARGLVNSKGANIGQEAMLKRAFNLGAEKVPGNLYASGGAGPRVIAKVLNSYKVAAHPVRGSLAMVQRAVAQGKGVIAGVDAGANGFWPPGGAPPNSGHAVTVTGVKYDDDGNVISYFINDTGAGDCGREILKDDFERAVNAWHAHLKQKAATLGVRGYRPQNVATLNPIW